MKIVYGLLCLFFLVLFHELGHFFAAKLFGVTVETFSIGFGPVLFHKKHGTTDYRLSLIPLGGYCGMKGEKDFVRSLESGLDHIEAESDSMYGVSSLKRAAIAFAGPFFNLFFTFLALTIILISGYTYYAYSSRITLADEVYPEIHSAARDAGILTGDVITMVNGTYINNFSDLIQEITVRPNEDVTITVDREGKTLSFTVHTDADSDNGTGKIGVTADSSSLKEYEAPRLPFFPAVWSGIKKTGQSVVLTVKGLTVLFKSEEITDSVSGPAQIIDRMGSAVKDGFSDGIRTGFAAMLDFMAVISVSLFVMNLLPVPVLDGGLILFAVIETVTRRKLPPKVLYYIQFAGIAFIVVLFILGFTGDIHYFKNNIRSVTQ